MNSIQTVAPSGAERLPVTVIFTACSVNYLDKAIAMGLSALDHHGDVDIIILVADEKRPVDIADSRIRLQWAEEIGFPGYLQCAFKYNIIEFNTALKPFMARRLLLTYERVIYLDPDVCVFAPIDSVHIALDSNAAVFTPHALSPYPGRGRPTDRDLLRFGSNNLGFFAVRRSEDATAFLAWWHDCCATDCYYEPHVGLGVDQKWVDLAFAFFDGMKLLKDPGLNVAFWNLHERLLSRSAEGWRVNGNTPLRFIHFSSFVEPDHEVVADKQSRYPRGSRPDFLEAAKVYREYLRRAKPLLQVADASYRYSRFDNGDPISPALRRLYAVSESRDLRSAANPFETNGAVHRFAVTEGLISPRPAATAHANFKVQASYSRQHRILTFAFRLALRVLGPDRYFNLMRYLAHYSSLLNQGDLLNK